YGDVILALHTQTFNENDITYFVPLSIQLVAHLGFFPSYLAADAAFDAWYVYQTMAFRGGLAAIPLNSHGHPDCQRAPDGVPLCEKGLRQRPQLGSWSPDARHPRLLWTALPGRLPPTHQHRAGQQPCQTPVAARSSSGTQRLFRAQPQLPHLHAHQSQGSATCQVD